MRNRTLARTLLFVGGALILGGCGDSRLRKLTVGISRDSALAIMGGKPERIDAYITGGQFIEALYYARPGRDSGTTPERKLSPVVLVDRVVVAWGWKEWEPIAEEHHIQLKQ